MASGSPGTSLLNSGTPLFPPGLARKKRCPSTPPGWLVRTLRVPREELPASGPFPCPTASVAPAATIETSFHRLPPPSSACLLTANHLRPVLIERALLQQSGLSLADHLLFAVLGHEKSARICFRACRLDEAHVVSPNDLIRRFGRILHTVNFLHRKDGVGPRCPLDVFHRADLKVRNHMVVLNLSHGILIAKFVHGIYAQVCGHHVQSLGKVSVHRVRRVSKVSTEELANYGSAFEVCRCNADRSIRRQANRCNLTAVGPADNQGVSILVHTEHCRGLYADVHSESE